MDDHKPEATNQTDRQKSIFNENSHNSSQIIEPKRGFIFGRSITPILTTSQALQLNKIDRNEYKAKSAVRIKGDPKAYKAESAEYSINWAVLMTQNIQKTPLKMISDQKSIGRSRYTEGPHFYEPERR